MMRKPSSGSCFLRTSLALALASFVLGCQPPPSASSADPTSNVDVGSVSLSLNLGSTFHFSTVHYDIAGSGYHVAADVNVANSTTFATTVGAIPFGPGYVVKLTAQEADRKLQPCDGTAVFDVASTVPVPVTVRLTCRELPTPSVPVPRGAVIALGLLLGALGLARLGRRRDASRTGAVSVLGVALAANLGCVSPPEAADVGGVGVSLQLAGGVPLNSFSYAITGPAAFARAGTIDTTHSSTATALISPLPVGDGFAITLESTSPDGSTHCTGVAPFSVTSGTTTDLVVHILCQEAPRTGTALIGGILNICPAVDSAEATLADGSEGATWVLATTAHDRDAAPAPLVYQWTAPVGGTLSDLQAQSPTLTCTVSGIVSVSLTVSDGDCQDVKTTDVDCRI